jgi:glycosyltransferase involved in cell wall biosynthesis
MSPAHVPAVSVVVPCYNGGRFIDQLLATLAAQIFRDFEIIIVDDGSGEETRQKLARLDPSITVLHQANQGPGAARNTGFRAARADFVLPLDCDDTLEPNHLEETVAALRAAPADVGFVFTHLRAVGAIQRIFPRKFNRFEILFSNKLPSCILMRKSVWETLGGYDESMRDGYEDWDFNIRMAAAGYRAIEIPKALYVYRVSDEGMLLSHCSSRHAAIWRSIREKNERLYRLPEILKAWRSARGTQHMPLPVALGILALAQLPDRIFTGVMGLYRYGRLFLQGWRDALRGMQTHP